MRLVAGIAMALFVLAILLSGKEKWIFVLMSTIQVKVFHELRRIHLTVSNEHLEKKQICLDWLLFVIAFICLIDVQWPGNANLFIWFMLYSQCKLA